jgi:hypothetical protein
MDFTICPVRRVPPTGTAPSGLVRVRAGDVRMTCLCVRFPRSAWFSVDSSCSHHVETLATKSINLWVMARCRQGKPGWP